MWVILSVCNVYVFNLILKTQLYTRTHHEILLWITYHVSIHALISNLLEYFIYAVIFTLTGFITQITVQHYMILQTWVLHDVVISGTCLLTSGFKAAPFIDCK